MSLLVKSGIERLSQLQIDAPKDWLGYGITNLQEVAALMDTGDIAVRGNGGILVRLRPGVSGYVLTSTGALQMPTWAPASTPTALYFPVWMGLQAPSASVYTPDHDEALDAPMTSPYTVTTVATETPVQGLTHAAALHTPDHDEAENTPMESCIHTEVETTAVLAAQFGYDVIGAASASIADIIRGSRYRTWFAGTATSIDAYVQVNDLGGGVVVPMKAAIYSRLADGEIWIATTSTVNLAAGAAAWVNFAFVGGPALVAGREYWLVVWAEDIALMEALLFYDSAVDCTIDVGKGLYSAATYNGYPARLAERTLQQAKYSIHCNYA